MSTLAPAPADAHPQGLPPPGLHPNTTEAEYAAWPALRRSVILAGSEDRDGTMAHMRHAELAGGGDTSEAKEFGVAFHCAIFEPGRFEREYTVAPKFDRRTKQGKADAEAWESANAGKVPIAEDDMMRLVGMQASILNHPKASKVIGRPGPCEVGCVWRDHASGVWCKVRFDKLLGGAFVIDAKSARSVAPRVFENDAWKYGYTVSAAMQADAFEAVTGEPLEHNPLFIAVQSKAPYITVVYSATDEMIEDGRREYRKTIRTYAACRASGRWPGYSDDIIDLYLPGWRARQIEGSEAS
jgi:hypothetical protein